MILIGYVFSIALFWVIFTWLGGKFDLNRDEGGFLTLAMMWPVTVTALLFMGLVAGTIVLFDRLFGYENNPVVKLFRSVFAAIHTVYKFLGKIFHKVIGQYLDKLSDKIYNSGRNSNE